MAGRPPFPLLVQALRTPSAAGNFSAAQWDLLLRQADSANVLATLHYLFEQAGVLANAPAEAREQLQWAHAVAVRHGQAVHWEVRLIQKALQQLGLPVVLLKGGAYATAGLPPAHGRLFSDIDILVPEARLAEVEAALLMYGWVTTHHNEYDQRYYREWMHELPPLRNVQRGTVIDVHHALLPRTAARHPDSGKLLAATQPVAEHPEFHLLSPADMVLHSATHLFADGEFDKGLRDLYDLHCLLTHFGSQPGFWESLPARAQEMQLGRYLYYGLRYTQELLGTQVPPSVLQALRDSPPLPLRPLMDALFRRALLPDHASCDDSLSRLARFLLYVRGNWLRMPPLRLARHLFHKAFLSPPKESEQTA
ncbi:nucleotidyltransferase domain-containing protein [Pseudoduganella sp. RAF53_2]|uniref:nucleotidyltransferase domain-containing protein n=1 Tax=unclassified Pseudoduganella TaxID=2637179 RepID=UPI003F986E79